jgi:hypothetical protein
MASCVALSPGSMAFALDLRLSLGPRAESEVQGISALQVPCSQGFAPGDKQDRLVQCVFLPIQS